MTQILMIYHIPEGNSSIRISFNRRLFCYRVQSNSGKFDKYTSGILKNYSKPVRSTVIFNKEKLERVEKLCEEFGIAKEFYEIKKIN